MQEIVHIFEFFVEILFIFFKFVLKFIFINHSKETDNKSDDDQGSNQMCPNINGLIVKHEQTPHDLNGIFIIQSVSISYVLIKCHKLRNLTQLGNFLFSLS